MIWSNDVVKCVEYALGPYLVSPVFSGQILVKTPHTCISGQISSTTEITTTEILVMPSQCRYFFGQILVNNSNTGQNQPILYLQVKNWSKAAAGPTLPAKHPQVLAPPLLSGCGRKMMLHYIFIIFVISLKLVKTGQNLQVLLLVKLVKTGQNLQVLLLVKTGQNWSKPTCRCFRRRTPSP